MRSILKFQLSDSVKSLSFILIGIPKAFHPVSMKLCAHKFSFLKFPVVNLWRDGGLYGCVLVARFWFCQMCVVRPT